MAVIALCQTSMVFGMTTLNSNYRNKHWCHKLLEVVRRSETFRLDLRCSLEMYQVHKHSSAYLQPGR